MNRYVCAPQKAVVLGEQIHYSIAKYFLADKTRRLAPTERVLIMIAIGVLLHAIGGFAAGSFYIPFRKVRNWAWESYWLVNGVVSWIFMPWIIAVVTVPGLISVLRGAPLNSIVWTYLFGLLWGIGGLTFGLSVRYLGMSLGYAIALGFCAAFGTIIPPIFRGEFGDLLGRTSGLITLGGILMCLVGIAICGWAGVSKERELPEEKKKEAVKEFNFAKGLWIAMFAGVMSACMAYGFAAGEPIAILAEESGTATLWMNTPVFIFILAGGLPRTSSGARSSISKTGR